MTIRIGINGFGRMGRLALRAAIKNPNFEIVHINEIAGDSSAAAHLLKYDSVHGTLPQQVSSDESAILIAGKRITYSSNSTLAQTDWASYQLDIILECTGKFKSQAALQPYLEAGIKNVVVSAPVKDGTLNIVMGVNHDRFLEQRPRIVTAASCTTNCIAPVIDVIHREFGIKHGSLTTIHDITNTQKILDEYHKDLRRARASGLSLIPTSTGSATAIAEIFPELKGKLNGLAVRVPLTNGSLTDLVLELNEKVTAEQANKVLREASEQRLKGILGYEEAPLVSADYTDDPRSGIIDALSTMVINDTQLKLYVWYDNEIGYVTRMIELAEYVAKNR